MENLNQQIPAVSIIVPVFNVEEYLGKCLDSLLAQTLHTIEIICVNDCSTDGSLQILKDFECRDNRIVIIDLPENRKQGGARNVGIKHARAPFLGFVDSDDWVKPEMYAELYALALEKEADMVCSDYYQYNSDDDIRLLVNCDASLFSLPLIERKKYILLQGARLVTNLVKKDLFTNNQIWYPEGLFYEDNAIVPVLYLAAKEIAKVNKPFYYYRYNNASTTRGHNNYRFFDRLITSKMFFDNMKHIGFYSDYKEIIDYRFTELFYINTILGAISQFTPPESRYVDLVKKEMDEILPDFKSNIYYKTQVPFKIRFILSAIQLHTKWGIMFYQLLKMLKK